MSETVTLTKEEHDALKRDAERYHWLRDQPRLYKQGGRPSWAPFVQNPRRSVLYAIAAYRGRELDAAVDEDRLNDLLNYLGFENEVNGDRRFADPSYRFSNEYGGRLEKAARRILRALIDFPNIRTYRRLEARGR